MSWPKHLSFLNYSMQKGKEILHNRHFLLVLAATKWKLILPLDFSFQWNDVWDIEYAQKEVGLIWQLWHKAIAIYLWHGKVSPTIDTICPMYDTREDESILHRFWSCTWSQGAWQYTTALLNKLEPPPQPNHHGRPRTRNRRCLRNPHHSAFKLSHGRRYPFRVSPSGLYGLPAITSFSITNSGSPNTSTRLSRTASGSMRVSYGRNVPP
jgi:hypothetical protein